MKGNILRSKDFILDNIKNKSTLNGYAILSHPLFDSCKTLQDQIILFHRLSPETTITSIISIFATSTTTFYKYFNSDFTPKHYQESTKLGRPRITNDEEELELIQWITNRQLMENCPTPIECREKMREIKKDDSHVFDRQWWRRFKNRHSNINVKVCSSIEKERTQLDYDKCFEMFGELISKFRYVESPNLIINMDETGFIKRYQKEITKKCVYNIDVNVSPKFIEQVDDHHFSLIGAITLGGKRIKPHLISTRKHLPTDLSSSIIKFNYSQSTKGYLNKEIMLEWVQKTLIPFINKIKYKENLSIESKTILIMDGLKAHCIDDLFQANYIEPVLLPPHSSHIWQPLDLGIFGLVKKYYNTSENTNKIFTNKFSMKINRIISSWYKATYPENILSSWRRAGYHIEINNGVIINVAINMTKILQNIEEHSNTLDTVL